MNKLEAIDVLCKHIWEMNKQAPHDFGGEQREFYIPKLNECMLSLAMLFPLQFGTVVLDSEEER